MMRNEYTKEQQVSMNQKVSVSTHWFALLRVFLFLAALLPPLYTFIAIQYSAITVPFWDHTELIRWIVPWYDGSYSFSSLWEPHNHTRPFVYRFILLHNALLTDWDIRSEYIYIYITLFGTFFTHVWVLRKMTLTAVHKMVFPFATLLLAIILFSPVGHNNHWWSMMLQLNAANLFIAFGMLVVFARPQSWSSHLLAAISCWLATYTLTNGFFAIIAIGLVFQLSATKLALPNRKALFWGCNLLFLAASYVPGIELSANSNHPSVLELVQFSLAYLGAPLAGLLWFPYQNMFDIPLSIKMSVACGSVLLITCVVLCWHARERLKEQHSAALILFGFSAFAILSSIITGWGRAAFDEYGVANGNASRYTIFGVYLLLGQIYYFSAGLAHGWWDKWSSHFIALIALIGFLVLSVQSYGSGVKVYVDAHGFNSKLQKAYQWGGAVDQDKMIHPDQKFVKRLKSDLQQYELGPYSSLQLIHEKLSVGNFKSVGLLSSGRQFSQSFTATSNGLKSVTITMVTPNGKQLSGVIDWKISEVGKPESVILGSLRAEHISDWESVRLKLPYIEKSKGNEYILTISSNVDDVRALGVAMYLPVSDNNAVIRIDENSVESKAESLTMSIGMEYKK